MMTHLSTEELAEAVQAARLTLADQQASHFLRTASAQFLGVLQNPEIEDIQALLHPLSQNDTRVIDNAMLALQDAVHHFCDKHQDYSAIVRLIELYEVSYGQSYPILSEILSSLRENNA